MDVECCGRALLTFCVLIRGLLDRRQLVWSRSACNHAQLPDSQLPPLADYDQPVSGLAPEFAAEWPELASCPWFLAVGDGAAANIGAGVTDSSKICVTVGTSAAARTIVHTTGDHAPQVSFVPVPPSRTDRLATQFNLGCSNAYIVDTWAVGLPRFTASSSGRWCFD